MKNNQLAAVIWGAMTLATTSGVVLAQATRPEDTIRDDEIVRSLKGKICTSRVGATFAFAKDGHYSYDGLWTDHGHYSVHHGAITILLESGIEKTFAISKRKGILYMEETAVTCT